MKSLSVEQLLKLQALAMRDGDVALRIDTWLAQGMDPRVAFVPCLVGEQQRAMSRCLDQVEMLALSGTVL